jgi:hypothetical protein
LKIAKCKLQIEPPTARPPAQNNLHFSMLNFQFALERELGIANSKSQIEREHGLEQ